MTNQHDDSLKNSLAQNGTFDPEKAEKLKTEVVGAFSARLRKVERIAWAYLVVCVCLGYFACLKFLCSSSTQALVGYGILLLVAYESTILIKLWYWVMNSKISLIKEIKQLQLTTLARQDATTEPRTAGLDGLEYLRLRALSRWERGAWLVGIMVVTVLITWFIVPKAYMMFAGREAGPDLTSEGYVILTADGSGTIVTRMSCRHRGLVPMTSFTFRSGIPAPNLRWIDDRGRELPFDAEDQHGRRDYTVNMIEPVMPGQPYTYTRVMESATLATRDADLWTYRMDWSYGARENQYSETVMLPEGAQLVSVDPQPAFRALRRTKPVLRFEARRGCNEHFTYTIRYRLPEPAE